MTDKKMDAKTEESEFAETLEVLKIESMMFRKAPFGRAKIHHPA